MSGGEEEERQQDYAVSTRGQPRQPLFEERLCQLDVGVSDLEVGTAAPVGVDQRFELFVGALAGLPCPNTRIAVRSIGRTPPQ